MLMVCFCFFLPVWICLQTPCFTSTHDILCWLMQTSLTFTYLVSSFRLHVCTTSAQQYAHAVSSRCFSSRFHMTNPGAHLLTLNLLNPSPETAPQSSAPTSVSPPRSSHLRSPPPESPSPVHPRAHPYPSPHPTSPSTPQTPSSSAPPPPSTPVSDNYSHTAAHRGGTRYRSPSLPLLRGRSRGIGRARAGGARGRRWFLRLGVGIWSILMLGFAVAHCDWRLGWWRRRMVTLYSGMCRGLRRSSLQGGRI